MNLASALLALALTISSSNAFAVNNSDNAFPASPNESLTPGSLCQGSKQKRYPEGIPYCSRNVKSALKKEVMREYDKTLGYQISEMNRAAFKIDHFLPLCMGGSNNQDNLWPQHVSIYEITDPLEPLFCSKMAEGKLRQADAVALIKRAKHNLAEVPAIIQQIERL